MQKITIAISGFPGSGSTTISKLLASKLGLNYFGAGRLFKDIAKGTYKEQEYYSDFKRLCDEKKIVIPELKSSDDSSAAFSLWNTSFGKSPEFNNIVDRLQAELGEKGNFVIDGKIAVFIVKNSFKIWIKADFETRVKRTIERDKIPLERVLDLLERRQQIERSEFKRIYRFDVIDQENKADIVIDSSNLSPEQISNIILDKLKSSNSRYLR